MTRDCCYHMNYLYSMSIICLFLLGRTDRLRQRQNRQSYLIYIRNRSDLSFESASFYCMFVLHILFTFVGCRDFYCIMHSKHLVIFFKYLQVTSVEVVQAYIDRIQEVNPLINAMVKDR